MNGFPVKPHGFITAWLVSGPRAEPFPAEILETDPLLREEALRALVADGGLACPPADARQGTPGLEECPWHYYNGMENRFVDASDFYHLLRRVELWAVCNLLAARARTLSATLWTYCAAELWLNGARIVTVERPVYKPIRKCRLELPLSAGINTLFVRLQTLGVRDTRSLFGLQLDAPFQDIGITTPDAEALRPVAEAYAWMESLVLRDAALVTEAPPPEPATLRMEDETQIWRAGTKRPLPTETRAVTLSMEVAGQRIERRFELAERFRPSYRPQTGTLASHRAAILAELAHSSGERNGGLYAFPVFGMLVNGGRGPLAAPEEELVRKDLEKVDLRVDCSDFRMAGLLRLYLRGNPGEALRARMKQTFLAWRYWMDEAGNDGMCFWSENHALLFFGCQLIAGGLFPDEHFAASGRSGAEQRAVGEERCRQWLDNVEREGFQEYLSGSYVMVTLAGLLNLCDFADGDIRERAGLALDRLLRQAALHSFRGVVMGPQGRVYRSVLRPHEQGMQALMHYIDPAAPAGHSMWMAFCAGSAYELPSDLAETMRAEFRGSYRNGPVEINLWKTRDFVLTSVSSPGPEPCPDALPEDWRADVRSYADVKRLNERYHGTTHFQPGAPGYQQHLWYAALDNDCVVFGNHPGGTQEFTPMRPGYWYGNGVLPLLRQNGNLLGVLYRLDETHPVEFTHVHWPVWSFEESRAETHWLFGRKGNGCIAMWCSAPLEAHNEVMAGCEYRAYARNVAYACLCAECKTPGDFEAFQTRLQNQAPLYNGQELKVTFQPGLRMVYPSQPPTQERA